MPEFMQHEPRGPDDELLALEPTIPVSDHLRLQYWDSTLHIKARWKFYEYADPPIDFYDKTLEHFRLESDDVVLDVGCADAADLVKLRRYGHEGVLVGLDKHLNLFDAPRSVAEINGHSPVELVVGDAEALPFPDNTFDALQSMFMLYHVHDIDKALTEFQRVLKPGGKLAVATSGRGNKARHRKFESDIADYLPVRTNAPPPMAEPFDAEAAQAKLPEFFQIVDHLDQSSPVRIRDTKGIIDYLESLQTMRPWFTPLPYKSDWDRAINKVVKPVIEEEIAANGFFEDRVERHLFIARNAK